MKCVRLSDKTTYAVKIYKRQDQCDNQIDVLKKAAMKKLPGVLRLVEVLTDSKWTYLIMELVEGVNLIDYLSKMSCKGKIAHKTFIALWTIVKSVHSLKYVHRRICFKNFYCLNGRPTDKPEFRLIGFSNAMPILHPGDVHIDFWSIGVCLYTFLCGHSPFDMRNNIQKITKEIEDGDFNQESDGWESLNKEAKRFIDQLLRSSTLDSSSKDLKFINNVSIDSVNNSKEQIDENEKIISIRAEKVQNYPANEFKFSAFNGFTNGIDPIESLEIISIHSDNQDENHSDPRESRNNHININGHVERAVKKQLSNKIEIENQQVKRQKTDNSDPSPVPVKLLQNLKIKKERIPQPAPTPRSLRAKPGFSYKQLSLKSKIRSSVSAFKKEKLPLPETAKRNAPKKPVQEAKPRGRSRKIKDQPERSIQLQPNKIIRKSQLTRQLEIKLRSNVTQRIEVTQQVMPPSKRTAFKKEKIHSQPTKPKTTIQPKKEVKYVSPNIAEFTHTDRAVQTESPPIPPIWVYQWPIKKPTNQPTVYCFERYDYE